MFFHVLVMLTSYNIRGSSHVNSSRGVHCELENIVEKFRLSSLGSILKSSGLLC